MDSLNFPLSTETKRAILSAAFDCSSGGSSNPKTNLSNESYFSYYRRVVEGSRAQLIPETHKDIANLIRLFKNPEATRESIENVLRQKLWSLDPEDREEVVESWICLALRLLLMMPTGLLLTVGRSVTVSGETKLNWKEGTLKALVDKEFECLSVMKESVKLEKIFNARNLERIGGIKVRWTSNLADHLRMRDDDAAVEIFHYASFLRFHQNW